jgi:hypothetical protein
VRSDFGKVLHDKLSDQELEDAEARMCGRKPELILTSEMSLPPDFDRSNPLEMWNVYNDRDLVAEVRQNLENAKNNSFDMLGAYSDTQLVCDMLDTIDWPDPIPSEEVLLMAIRRVRLDPSGALTRGR